MSFGYVTIDGERVEAHVAADFKRMAAAFLADNGYTLHINDGTRTRDEQAYLYNGWINRLPGFNLAAHPDSPYAYHVESNPSGPRAIDIRDSAPFPGVMTRGTKHDLWMQRNASRFNFENEGYKFKPVEAWHKKWLGSFSDGIPAGGESTPIDQTVQNQQNWMNATRGEQLEPDGRPGPLTTEAIKRYQIFLKADWGYAGEIDGRWGAGTQLAHQRYYDDWQEKHPAPVAVPAFPLPAGYYFGPKDGPEQSVSGYYSHREDLKQWQQRMKDRGWSIDPDGLYGASTKLVAESFQREKDYTRDGLIGPETWKGAWTAPVTPPPGAPVTPTPPVVPPSPPVVTEPPSVPAPGYVPTKEENPRGLLVVPASYPGAKYALQAPLGDGVRGWKGSPAVQVELIVDTAIEHWTGVDALQYDWFSYKNSRSACPNWYITPAGEVVEFIPFEAKPALTGAEWNWRSVGWEIQKVPGGEGTLAQFEAVCRLLAWLHSLDGTVYRGVPVRFSLDREHFKSHRECASTECPGEWWHSRMDLQLAHARELFESGEYPGAPNTTPGPDPEPEPEPEPGKMVLVEREAIVELRDWADEVLGD